MRSDISVKVNFLELVPLFAGISTTDLVPFASNLEVIDYEH
jgi:hypothetical protein